MLKILIYYIITIVVSLIIIEAELQLMKKFKDKGKWWRVYILLGGAITFYIWFRISFKISYLFLP